MHSSASPQHSDTDTRAWSDAELVARVGCGESLAFETLMRRYNRLLFRSARGVVSDDAEAQDVVQEAYLRAFSSLDSFRGDCELGTWLARIAIRIALDVQRKHKRSVTIDGGLELDVEPTGEHLMAFNASPTDSPDSRAERNQMRALLQQAIDSLPPMYRCVFILRAVQEMSVGEAAACLDLSDDLVKTRYLRARSMLRDALGARVEAYTHDVYAFAGARCDALVAQVLAQLQRVGYIQPAPPG